MKHIDAYPLSWPAGWPRIKPEQRVRGRFSKKGSGATSYGQRELTVTEGAQRVLTELQRLGISSRGDVIISSNLEVRLDGLPRSGQRMPEDPGVAVYWADKDHGDEPRCMAIDLYDRVADNLAAIAATLEAMRAISRHGGAQIHHRAFQGFTALPAPGQATGRGWREILGFEADANPTFAAVEHAYKKLRSNAHPDKNKDAVTDDFMSVQSAFEMAKQELKQ